MKENLNASIWRAIKLRREDEERRFNRVQMKISSEKIMLSEEMSKCHEEKCKIRERESSHCSILTTEFIIRVVQ